jgi:hypothetical protein
VDLDTLPWAIPMADEQLLGVPANCYDAQR